MTENRRLRIGDLLVERGAITEAQLTLALEEQRHSGKRLGNVLVDLGMVRESEFLQIIADKLGLPFIDLRRMQVNSDIAEKLPEQIARRHRAVPIEVRDGVLVVGLADPTDLPARDDISRNTAVSCEFAVVRESDAASLIDQLYRNQGQLKELAGALEGQLKDSAFDLDELVRGTTNDDAPVVQLVQRILEEAHSSKASDVHIEPGEKELRVRMRVDGQLREQVMQEKKIASAMVMRFKILSNLDISERRLPQDGRFKTELGKHTVDVRVATMPTQYGEALTLRLLDQSAGMLDLNSLGMPESMQQSFSQLIERPHGLILVTGPTGSGKTTTLYAALNQLNRATRKIITAEDPIEYRLPRINQVQVHPQIGLDFPSILRSAMRHDPDVLLVGEMRDEETVRMGIRASLTGHLVLSTMHTNDAQAAAVRLADMGVEPYLVASALRAVVGQRLVRCLCDNCREPAKLDSQQRVWLRAIAPNANPTSFYTATGCMRCQRTGYRGRRGVYELLVLNESMLDALREQNISDFNHAVKQSTYTPLVEHALELAMNGVTSIDEVMRLASDIGTSVSVSPQPIDALSIEPYSE
ncbi:GspE/PulE family protein [Salinibius halmophilus]|uniref:GspE/PulE family protein n=1 Tax=Salinibius halmophilus TaxID=1853216 RepID=UPI000E668E74|nr:GspE/PulE family protein [Salinibius halmophilus]